MLAYEIVSRFQPKSKRLRDKLQNKLQNNIAFTDQKLCNNKFMWCFRKMKLNFKIDIGILGNKLGRCGGIDSVFLHACMIHIE